MKVPDLLKSLALGELSNLSLAEGGDIASAKIPTIIQYANEGLLRLHSRFLLREKDLVLELREGITHYHLKKKFAYSQYDRDNPPERWNMPYIMDLGREPFLEDVVKVLAVFNHLGMELPINDEKKILSVFTPQPTILQVPHVRDDKMLAVNYQASHPVLPITEYGDIDINLPDCLHGALRAFIANKVFTHMNTGESTAKGQEHLMNFETQCQEAIDMDLVCTSRSTTNTRFEERGFR